MFLYTILITILLECGLLTLQDKRLKLEAFKTNTDNDSGELVVLISLATKPYIVSLLAEYLQNTFAFVCCRSEVFKHTVSSHMGTTWSVIAHLRLHVQSHCTPVFLVWICSSNAAKLLEIAFCEHVDFLCRTLHADFRIKASINLLLVLKITRLCAHSNRVPRYESWFRENRSVTILNVHWGQ